MTHDKAGGGVARPFSRLSAAAVLLCVGPTLLVACLMLAWIADASDKASTERLRASARGSAEVLAAAAAGPLSNADVAALNRLLRASVTSSDVIEAVEVFDAAGVLIAAADRTRKADAAGQSPSAKPQRHQASRAQAQILRLPPQVEGVDHEAFDAVDVAPAGQVVVWVSPAQWERAAHRELLITGAVTMILGLGAAILLVGTWASGLARRVNDVLRTLRQMPSVALARDGNGKTIQAKEPPWPTPGSTASEIRDIELELPMLWARQSDLIRAFDAALLQRTGELLEANKALGESDERRRALVEQANELLEDERRKVAVELHDQTNASAISIRMASKTLADVFALPQIDLESRKKCTEAIVSIRRATDDLYDAARALIRQLRPEAIDTVGLGGALEDLVLTTKESDLSCTYIYDDHDELSRIRGSFAIGAFRIAQESLNNIRKHASADYVEVHAWVEHPTVTEEGLTEPPGGNLVLEVIDNGAGFDTDRASAGSLGLVGMRERALALGGTLTVVSAPGEGTTIRFEAPIPSGMLP